MKDPNDLVRKVAQDLVSDPHVRAYMQLGDPIPHVLRVLRPLLAELLNQDNANTRLIGVLRSCQHLHDSRVVGMAPERCECDMCTLLRRTLHEVANTTIVTENLLGDMLDIHTPEHGVEIDIRHDGKVLWVSTDGVTRVRICDIPVLVVRDRRETGVSDDVAATADRHPGQDPQPQP